MISLNRFEYHTYQRPGVRNERTRQTIGTERTSSNTLQGKFAVLNSGSYGQGTDQYRHARSVNYEPAMESNPTMELRRILVMTRRDSLETCSTTSPWCNPIQITEKIHVDRCTPGYYTQIVQQHCINC